MLIPLPAPPAAASPEAGAPRGSRVPSGCSSYPPEGDRAQVLATDGGEVFDPMGKGHPMKEMVLLPPATLEDPAQLTAWLARAIDFTDTLPPKPKKKAPAKKKAAAKKKAPAKKAPAKKKA